VVTDNDDNLITGLSKGKFKVYEDNVEQEIRHFVSEDLPVSAALVLDSSGSMKDKLEKAKIAVLDFLRTSNPEDEYALIQFNDRARIAERLTQDTGEILNQLEFIQPHGRTALLDAIGLAIDELKHAHYARKAIFIISDGGDNHSRANERQIKKRAQEAGIQVYSIGILAPADRALLTPEEVNGPRLLQSIASVTGGSLFAVYDPNDLPDIANKIGMALRNQYVLAYSPAQPKRDGKYHRIKVRLEWAKGEPKLHVTFRASYLSPER
jgi:Ca-activated chloride channel family protein